MRVLQLAQKPQLRGAELATLSLSDELRRRGHDSHTAFLYRGTVPVAIALGEHVSVLQGNEGAFTEKLPGLSPRVLWRLARLVHRLRPDVVQANGGRTLKYAAALKAVGALGHAKLLYRNIGDPERWVDGRARKFGYGVVVASQIDGVAAVSQHTLAGVRRVYGTSVPAIVVAQGVDPRALGELDDSQDQDLHDGPTLLVVGALSEEKCPHRALEVLTKVAENARLWFVGDGPLRSELEALVAGRGLASRVRFWGAQTRLRRFYVAADVLLLTSDTEGLPGVVLEAAYCGTPAVAMNVGGVSECIRHQETGMLVPAADVDAMARATADLLANPQQAQALGKQAGAWIEERFLLDSVARQYLVFYERLVSEAP